MKYYSMHLFLIKNKKETAQGSLTFWITDKIGDHYFSNLLLGMDKLHYKVIKEYKFVKHYNLFSSSCFFVGLHNLLRCIHNACR